MGVHTFTHFPMEQNIRITQEDKEQRSKQIARTSIIGIISNLFLSGFKATVGLISGSIAIVLDAVNNLTDALSSVITIAGVKLAKRKPNARHPFGMGRVEYFSAILISILILVTGVTSLIESVEKIITPASPEYDTAVLIVVSAAIIVKLLLGRFVKAQGIRFNSDALVASGTDAMFDSIISAATLVGAIVMMVWGINLDGWLGCGIAVMIIKAGIEMLASPVSQVIGRRPDSEITKSIKQTVREIPGVLGAYDLILHDYGPDKALGSVHVEIPDTMSAREIHLLTSSIQHTIYSKFSVMLTVGIYAVHQADDDNFQLGQRIRKAMLTHQGAIGFHGLLINDQDKYLSFDVLLDFSSGDRSSLREAMEADIAEILPGYRAEINFDTDFSD